MLPSGPGRLDHASVGAGVPSLYFCGHVDVHAPRERLGRIQRGIEAGEDRAVWQIIVKLKLFPGDAPRDIRSLLCIGRTDGEVPIAVAAGIGRPATSARATAAAPGCRAARPESRRPPFHRPRRRHRPPRPASLCCRARPSRHRCPRSHHHRGRRRRRRRGRPSCSTGARRAPSPLGAPPFPAGITPAVPIAPPRRRSTRARRPRLARPRQRSDLLAPAQPVRHAPVVNPTSSASRRKRCIPIQIARPRGAADRAALREIDPGTALIGGATPPADKMRTSLRSSTPGVTLAGFSANRVAATDPAARALIPAVR